MERLAGDDAVAPVIAIVLMVAITVIIAAVIGAFSLTLAESEQKEPVHAAVQMDVVTTENKIDVHVTSMGNAEFILIRGPLADDLQDSPYRPYLTQTGESMTLVYDEEDVDRGQLKERGSAAAVAVQGNFHDEGVYPDHPDARSNVPIAAIIPVEQQTQVRVVDYDFR